jgi:hypothetical protein
LLTNVPGGGEGTADAKEILSLYKEQHGVEQDFSFLKDPAVVNAIFLETEERIEALGLKPDIFTVEPGAVAPPTPTK